ncbi:hypothetical protein H0H87_009311 [Tephrocybe sp. NHM501043]|nr:hypothetical protein H0H87_009311 [Tephrocybe sp. NHM501043]
MHISPSILSLLFLAYKWPSAIATPLKPSFMESRANNPFPYDPGFPVQKVLATALNISSHSWEYGTASEALLELYDPDLSVFGDFPFQSALLVSSRTLPRGLAYAAEKIVIGTGQNALSDGDGAVGDPASLGVAAVLLGKLDGYEKYGAAAVETFKYVTQDAPRAWNGAISHRTDYIELWFVIYELDNSFVALIAILTRADFVYMAPPFLAYHAVDTSNFTLLREAVYQCHAYRDILRYNSTSPHGAFTGLWEHILGPVNNDPGLWSTGNAWAAAGMTRVLATIIKAPIFLRSGGKEAAESRQWRSTAITKLTTLIKEIVDATINASPHAYDGGLIRNYFDKPTIFGEISGSSLLAATVYRLAVLRPTVFGKSKYIKWAEGIRHVLGGTFIDANGTEFKHVDGMNGTVRPAVNPLGWGDINPWMTGSPEDNVHTDMGMVLQYG